MQEQLGLFKSDDFLIADTQGKPYFKLDASIWTSHRQLLDIYNNPVLQVIKNQDGIFHGDRGAAMVWPRWTWCSTTQ